MHLCEVAVVEDGEASLSFYEECVLSLTERRWLCTQNLHSVLVARNKKHGRWNWWNAMNKNTNRHTVNYGFPVREVCNFITFSLHTSTNIDRAVVVNGLCIVTQWKWKMKRLTVHRSKIYRLVLISSSRLTRGSKRGIDDGKQKVNNSSVLSLCIVFMCV